MSRTYVIWWHSKFIDEISRDNLTIGDIINKAVKIMKYLEELRIMESKGEIKVKVTDTLNPIYIEILDDSKEILLLFE